MKKSVSIDLADNGYVVNCYGGEKEDSEEKSYDMYHEPEKLIAKDIDEVLELVKKHLEK